MWYIALLEIYNVIHCLLNHAFRLGTHFSTMQTNNVPKQVQWTDFIHKICKEINKKDCLNFTKYCSIAAVLWYPSEIDLSIFLLRASVLLYFIIFHNSYWFSVFNRDKRETGTKMLDTKVTVYYFKMETISKIKLYSTSVYSADGRFISPIHRCTHIACKNWNIVLYLQ